MNTDDQFTPRPIAAWFIIAAVASLLFMGFGVVSFVMHIFADPSAMPLDQRAAYLAEPLWVKIAYGVAVFAGLAGAILLVMAASVTVPILYRPRTAQKTAPEPPVRGASVRATSPGRR